MSDDYMYKEPLSAKKKQFYWLTEIDRPIPAVGIFDEPRRCYVINQEWARIVIGFTALLAQPELWRDAEDELYQPIQEILKFLEGNDCAMTLDCEQLNDCLEQATIIQNIQQDIRDMRDFNENGASEVEPDTTIINNYFPYDEQLANIGDLTYTDCEPDEIWSAVSSVVDYIHQTNVDFLQRISSATNLANQMERAISATPVIGWFPLDEIVGVVDWYADEAYAAYNAVVDTELLLKTKCDLFCLALISDPCGLNFADMLNYFAGKVPATADQFVATLSNLVLFAITGTFAGDDYFYYMSLLQLTIAGIGEKFLNTRGMETYAIYAAAGKNSPDADWALFCDECPQYSYIEFDFRNSPHGFESTNGGQWQQGVGWVANVTAPNSTASMEIVRELPITWNGYGVGMEYSAYQDCGLKGHNVQLWMDTTNLGGGGQAWIEAQDNLHMTYTRTTSVPPDPVDFNKIVSQVHAVACGATPAKAIIHRIRIWLSPQSEMKGQLTMDFPQGLGANGSTSMDFWQ